MKLFEHENYNHYKEAQIKNNKRKLNRTWAVRGEMKYLSEYIKERIPDVQRGMCHGVRNGNEVKWFKEFLPGADIIGTDISPTVKQFGGVQWDFHDFREDWAGRFDFIYSNSFDHAYDPDEAIKTWLRCIKPQGVCVIQWSPCGNRDAPLNAVDCFSARLMEYKGMFGKHGNLVTTLRSKDIRKHDNVLLYFLIVERHGEEIRML
jgi:SAM-dependent methyltransferase